MFHNFLITTLILFIFIVIPIASCSSSSSNGSLTLNLMQKGLSLPLIPPLSPRSPFYPQILATNNISISDVTSQKITLNRTHFWNWLLNSDNNPDAHSYMRWPWGSRVLVTSLSIGTKPNQDMDGIFDTGSDLVWFQGEARANKTGFPYFSQRESSTFKPFNCGDTSKCMPDPSITSCPDPNQPCRFDITYGDGSFARGVMATDVLTFISQGPRFEKWKEFIFGVSSANDDESMGMIGAGNSPYSIHKQLYPSDPVFSYCISEDWSKTSAVSFGYEVNLEGRSLNVKTNPRYPFYYMEVVGIKVNGRDLPIDRSVFNMSEDGERGFIIDSGTKFTDLALEAFYALKKEVERLLGKSQAKIGDFPICYPRSTFGKYWPRMKRPTFSIKFTDFVYDVPESRAWEEVIPKLECLKVAASPWSSMSVHGYDMLRGANVGHDPNRGKVFLNPRVCPTF